MKPPRQNGGNALHPAPRAWRPALAAVFAGLLVAADLSAQCAMCRTALTSSAEGERWARGINAGVMLLLAAPFLVVGAIALFLFRRQVCAAVASFRARCAGVLSRFPWRASNTPENA